MTADALAAAGLAPGSPAWHHFFHEPQTPYEECLLTTCREYREGVRS